MDRTTLGFGAAQHTNQRTPIDHVGDSLAGRDDIVEQRGEIARYARQTPLLLDDELGQCRFRVHSDFSFSDSESELFRHDVGIDSRPIPAVGQVGIYRLSLAVMCTKLTVL